MASVGEQHQSDAVPICPICGGRMELVYDSPNLRVIVCVDCYSGIQIPAGAWDVALGKRALKPTGYRRRSSVSES